MGDRVLRDHSKPCGHDMGAWREWDEQGEGFVWQCTTISCPGGREVTAAEIQEMAYSLWQAEQMDEYHRDVL